MEGYSSDDSAKLASSSHDKRQSQEQPSLGADEQKQEHPVSFGQVLYCLFALPVALMGADFLKKKLKILKQL